MGILKRIFGKSNSEPVGELEETEAGDADGQLAVDVFQEGDNVIVKSTIAGVRPEDLDISIASDSVSISGERKQVEEVNEQDYFYQECYWGSFSRSFSLPVEIDVDRAEADLRDGILTLTLPKTSRTRQKKVRIKGEV